MSNFIDNAISSYCYIVKNIDESFAKQDIIGTIIRYIPAHNDISENDCMLDFFLWIYQRNEPSQILHECAVRFMDAIDEKNPNYYKLCEIVDDDDFSTI